MFEDEEWSNQPREASSRPCNAKRQAFSPHKPLIEAEHGGVTHHACTDSIQESLGQDELPYACCERSSCQGQ